METEDVYKILTHKNVQIVKKEVVELPELQTLIMSVITVKILTTLKPENVYSKEDTGKPVISFLKNVPTTVIMD
jgi:hypothetical protein